MGGPALQPACTQSCAGDRPAHSYLAFYKAYQPLLVLNVEAYVGALALKGTDLSLAEITQEVALHTAQLATMEEQLQGSINLGLIQVNCNKVSVGMAYPLAKGWPSHKVPSGSPSPANPSPALA